MPTDDTWAALRDLAGCWRACSSTETFIAGLPTVSLTPLTGIADVLQDMYASMSSLFSNPLLFANNLPLAASVMPNVNMGRIESANRGWFQAARHIEEAHRQTVAWLRSRLPGYPNLPAPQLARDTPLTTGEFSPRVVWRSGERSKGLQLGDVPASIGQLLTNGHSGSGSVNEATRALVSSLVSTAEWTQLSERHDQLDDATRLALREARARTKTLLSPTAIDKHEPSLVLPRAAYREHVVATTLSELEPTARAYADAFDEADRIIEGACSRVFGLLTCLPILNTAGTEIEIIPGRPTTTRFRTQDFRLELPGPMPLVCLGDPMLPDALLVTGVSVSLANTGGADIQATAEVLTGTAAAWQ
jgi:hypothetical protein